MFFLEGKKLKIRGREAAYHWTLSLKWNFLAHSHSLCLVEGDQDREKTDKQALKRQTEIQIGR